MRILDAMERSPRPFRIYVTVLDRLFRNLEYQNRCVRRINEHGSELVFVHQRLDLKTADGRFTANILGSTAQHFSERLGERMTLASRASLLRGKWPHRPPARYRVGDVPGIPQPMTCQRGDGQADLLGEGLRQVAQGEAKATVHRGLVKRGLRMKRTQFFNALRGIRLQFYAGFVVVDGQEIQGQWPAIIDRATYDKIQRPLRVASTRPYTKLNPAFPLKSHVRCSCGRPLTSDAGPKGKNPKWREYYRCPATRKLTNDAHVNIRPDDLHGPFLDLLQRLTPAPGFDADEIRAALVSRRERVQRDLGAERTRLAAIERDQRQATDRYIKAPSAAVADALAARLAELKDHHAAIAAKVAELESEQRHQQADEQRTIERINVAMADLPQAWADGSLQVRQAIVKLAFPEGLTVDVQPDGNQEIRTPILARFFRLNSRMAGRRPAWRPQEGWHPLPAWSDGYPRAAASHAGARVVEICG